MDPRTGNSNSARTSAVEQHCVQLVEETSKVKMVGIQEATITFKGFAAVAAGPLPEAPSGDGPSTPAATNSVTSDLLQVLVNEMSSIRHTLESLSQEVHTSNKLLAFICSSEQQGLLSDYPYYNLWKDAGVQKLVEGILLPKR